MFHRLGQCHKALELATGGALNVLEQPGVRQPKEAAGQNLMTGAKAPEPDGCHQNKINYFFYSLTS